MPAGEPTRNVTDVVDHLFRREAGKMVAYLTRLFGLDRLNVAEDVVQETLIRAYEAWSLHGLPENPSAWLMRTARNRALDLMRRDDRFRFMTPELSYLMSLRESAAGAEPKMRKEIEDDQLRMILSCCHPGLSAEVQVTLILKTLCGFSVAEIGSALLTGDDAIEKRLGRARKLFRESGTFVALDDAEEIPARLDAVHQAIYLLFNEGYHASRSDRTVRGELCAEAIRLATLLGEHPQGARPRTFALLALFHFHAARLPGRIDSDGGLIPLEFQDRTTWDREMIHRGFRWLDRSATGGDLSEFHLEAAIAAIHSGTLDYADTDWEQIESLYDLLYGVKPTPIVALNRAIAVGMARGAEAGLEALSAIPDVDRLRDYPFLSAARGEFLRRAGRLDEARASYREALVLARNDAEKRFFEMKLAE